MKTILLSLMLIVSSVAWAGELEIKRQAKFVTISPVMDEASLSNEMMSTTSDPRFRRQFALMDPKEVFRVYYREIHVPVVVTSYLNINPETQELGDVEFTDTFMIKILTAPSFYQSEPGDISVQSQSVQAAIRDRLVQQGELLQSAKDDDKDIIIKLNPKTGEITMKKDSFWPF